MEALKYQPALIFVFSLRTVFRHSHQDLSRIVLVWEIYPKGSAALALCVRGPYLNGKAQNHQRPWYTQSTS